MLVIWWYKLVIKNGGSFALNNYGLIHLKRLEIELWINVKICFIADTTIKI